MWMLLLANAAALVSLVVIVWRLQRQQSLVMLCVCARTLKYGNEWISFEQYLARRFNIQVSRGIRRDVAARLRTHFAWLSAEERPTHPSLGRQRLALLEHRHRPTVSQRSALEDFPSEENSLEPLRRLS
jgi:hypothetical protein